MPRRTIDEIQEEMRGIANRADQEDRHLTAQEAEQYETLEAELQEAQRSQGIRDRQTAYDTPAAGQLATIAHIGSPHVDDGLEQAFTAYLRTGQPNQDIAGLRVTMAQGTGSDPAGGYTVPEGFRQKLVERMKAFGGLAGEVETITTDTGAPLPYPSNDDTDNEGQITAEGANFAGGDDLVFGEVVLNAFKYTSAGANDQPLKVSVELAQDSAFDIGALVARKLGTRIARKQARDWAVGTGTSMPQGITQPAGDVETAAANTIAYEDLLDTEAQLDPAYEQNAAWVMSKATWARGIRGIVDNNGRPLILEEAASGIGGRPARVLLGYPVIIDQAMPAFDSAAGAKFAVLGDLREAYVIRRVSNLVVVVNPYSSAASGQIEYTAWERADGKVQARFAYVILFNNDGV